MAKKSKKKPATAAASGDVLKSILVPVADDIEAVRVASNGIVVVVHKPGPVTKQAFAKLEVKLEPKTSVFGLPCEHAVAAFGHDLVTKRWMSNPPADEEIKIFLCSGEGSALLTMSFENGQVHVKKEPDIYPVGGK